MSVTVQDIMQVIETKAPKQLAEHWDNVGLQIGNPADTVTGVLTALDVTIDTVQRAIEQGCNLIVSHHPLLFKGLKCIDAQTPMGNLVMTIIQHGISVYAAHTNLDIAPEGLNDVVGRALGLTGLRGLTPTSETDYIGRIGRYEVPLSVADFQQRLEQALPKATIRYAGVWPTQIQTVGLCTGAGVEFMKDAKQQGADAYVTGDVKYHEAQEAKAQGMLLVDAGHYGTEIIAMSILADWIREGATEQGWDLRVIEDTAQQDFFLTMVDNG